MQKKPLTFEQVYIPLAVVLILVLGGVFVWKWRSLSSAPAPMVEAQPSPSPESTVNSYVPAAVITTPASVSPSPSSVQTAQDTPTTPYKGDATPLSEKTKSVSEQKQALLKIVPYSDEGHFAISFDQSSALFVVKVQKPYKDNTRFFELWRKDNNFELIPAKDFSFVYLP